MRRRSACLSAVVLCATATACGPVSPVGAGPPPRPAAPPAASSPNGSGVPASGDTALVYVQGKGAEGCPGEDTFRTRSAPAFEDEDPFVPAGQAASARIRVEITREGGTYRGVYSRLDAQGNARTASVEEHRDCDALVWMLADRMHLSIARRPPPVSTCPACPRCPACPPHQPAGPAVCDAACMERIKDELCERYGHCMDLTLTVMAGGLMSAGWTLDVGPGAWLGFEVRHDWLSVGAEMRGMFPAAALRYYDSPPDSDLLSFSGLFVPCARWKVLFGCLMVELGQVTFTVPGGLDFKEVSDVLFSFGPRVGVDVPIGRGFSARGFAELPIRPYGPAANITDLDDPNDTVRSWELPYVNGFFGVGIAWSR